MRPARPRDAKLDVSHGVDDDVEDDVTRDDVRFIGPIGSGRDPIALPLLVMLDDDRRRTQGLLGLPGPDDSADLHGRLQRDLNPRDLAGPDHEGVG